LLLEIRPDLVVLALGVRPHLAPLDAMSWEQFSEPWNIDVKAAFHWVKSALQIPIAPASSMVIMSSGAAIGGSPLSGGYAGAKRMQWLLASYAQRQSDARKLGIRTIAVLPTQFIEGTEIGDAAATAYGAAQGLSASQVMSRFERPLDVEKVTDAILAALRGEIASGITAITLSGKGIEPLP
jgi:NADP-dependent 3-hydroxy acid dehydrogenase YdfG